jgi:hypothetical protein
MAADLTGSGEAVEPTPETTAMAASPAAPPARVEPVAAAAPPHRLRFALIYGVLGAILVAAIFGVVVFANRSINPAPQWSAWRPSGGGLGASKQIADHVAQTYHLPGGAQLVDVLPKEPSISPSNATLPVHFVVIKGLKGAPDQVFPISSTDSVQYSLCGLGASCEIATGKPSVERGELVRREILELALYTFKYVHGINNVIAFMPTTAGKSTKYVVYLQRKDLAAELKQPLATTLSKHVPLPKAIPQQEAKVIDQTAGAKLYTFSGVAQAQQGDLVFVLTPLPPA